MNASRTPERPSACRTSRSPRGGWLLLLAIAVTGCVVNPVPTPASGKDNVAGEGDDGDLEGKDAVGRGVDRSPQDSLAGAHQDATEPAAGVTESDAGDAGTDETSEGVGTGPAADAAAPADTTVSGD